MREKRSGVDRRKSMFVVPTERRKEERRKACFCGAEMQKQEIELPGSKQITFPVMICPKCGRHKYIKTMTFLSTRLAGVEPVVKSLGRTGTNYVILIPREIEKALSINDDTQVELAVEGFNRLTVRVLNKGAVSEN